MLTDHLALFLFAVAGWLLSAYFGFFRFKQYVWSRRKVSYDLFTRQSQRRQSLANRLQRLCAVPKEGRGIQEKRRLAAVSYLEQLRESQLLAVRGIVGGELVDHWVSSTLNQLSGMSAATRDLLRETNSSLADGFTPLDQLIAAASAEHYDRMALRRSFSETDTPKNR